MSWQRISPFSWLIFTGYLSILFFFNQADVYHQHFYSTGLIVVAYNFARVLFIFYFIWLMYAVGDIALNYIGGQIYQQNKNLNFWLASFFTGFGIWHIFLLALGFAGLYQRLLMAALSVLVLGFSLPQLTCCLKQVMSQRRHINAGFFLVLFCAMIFIMIKGLYPSGGHDYFNHYFMYYRAVIENGNISPNDVWYHFYYSKGTGLFFLSMLLTDPLGPQLPSASLILIGSVLVFLLLKPKASWHFLPWLGAALYLLFITYTPGPYETMRQGGWGDLEKHEPASVLVLAIIWLSLKLSEKNSTRIWGASLALSLIALTLIEPAMAIIGCAFLSLMVLYYSYKKDKSALIWTITSIACGTSTFILLTLINYWLTGLPEDQIALSHWSIHVDKLKNWGVVFELFMLYWGRLGMVNSKIPLYSHELFLKEMTYLRLDVWLFLFLIASGTVLFALARKKSRQALLSALDKKTFYAMASFLVLMIVLSLFIGRDQPVSYYRFTSFLYAPMLCFCLLLLSATLRSKRAGIIFTCSYIAICALLVGVIDIAHYGRVNPTLERTIGQYDAKLIGTVAANSFRFATGQYSLHDGYVNQQGLPGRMPWGAIYPALETAWKILPPKTRIWSMHIHTYCMLPDCHLEAYASFRFSHHPEIIFYGDPLVAKQLLQQEKLNYFFISHVLPIQDPLPRSPLFSPEHIAEYLGIAWTDGDNTLLTWKEQAIAPLSEEWIKRYKKRVDKSGTVRSYPDEQMKKALMTVDKNKHLKLMEIVWE